MAGCTNAAVLDTILGNFGSDIAPLLALLGEQVTLQYLARSLSWVDNFFFALAPLGIITAVVSAIRVAGGKSLRSFIGRAKESREIVELELMSSTSADVCEMWNGESIDRILGIPAILQFIYIPRDCPYENQFSGAQHEIYTVADAIKEGYYLPKHGSGVGEAEEPLYHLTMDPPSLILNVCSKSLKRPFLLVLGVFGVALQVGVLVFSALIQYQLIPFAKNAAPAPAYAFYVTVGGTLLLGLGVFLCARIIEKSTEETYWAPTDSHSFYRSKLVWLQQGGQTIDNQIFESFAHISSIKDIITSRKKGFKGRFRDGRQLRYAISTTIIGFIAQFIGFRATHPYAVTLAQLGVIFIMNIVRSCVQVEAVPRNNIKRPSSVQDGQELDWLAANLKGCEGWEVVAGLDNPCYLEHKQETNAYGMSVMLTRARIAELSKEWDVKTRTTVRNLKVAIEATMDIVFARMVLEGGSAYLRFFTWTLEVMAKSKLDGGVQASNIDLTLTREMDENGIWGSWKTDPNHLEAVLGLWVTSIKNSEQQGYKKQERNEQEYRYKSVRLLGPDTQGAREDYKLWIYRETPLSDHRTGWHPEGPKKRYFGWAGNEASNDVPGLDINAEGDLYTLCAQELYSWFMFRLATMIKDVGGETAPRTGSSTFSIVNSNLVSIADAYSASGLGSVESAYISIIPALRASKRLPVLDYILTKACDLFGGKDGMSRLKSDEEYQLLNAASRGGSSRFVEWYLSYLEPKDLAEVLQAAARGGYKYVVQLLLTKGADVNAAPAVDSGRTALQAAAGSGHESIVAALLKAGADVNAAPASESGRTALQAAADGDYETIVKILKDAGAVEPAQDSSDPDTKAAELT